jgi:hypothetical protein
LTKSGIFKVIINGTSANDFGQRFFMAMEMDAVHVTFIGSFGGSHHASFSIAAQQLARGDLAGRLNCMLLCAYYKPWSNYCR